MTRDSTWWRYNAAARRLTLTLRVQANAGKNGVAGPYGDALKIRIAAPAVDNKANAELIGFLSETLDLPKSSITIRQGVSGRRKIVEISGGPELAARLGNLA